MSDLDFKTALTERFRKGVAPLIGRNAVLWDLPYHNNIGDFLIWQGTADMLHSLGVRVHEVRSHFTCTFPPLKPDVTIVMNGGGNFGTLYPAHQIFRREVLRRYPDNRVVVMPQSVYYGDTPESAAMLRLDREAYGAHRHVTLCARDRVSYDFMRDNFSGTPVLLIPDAAFCIDERRLEPYRRMQPVADTLFLRRLDKEITSESDSDMLAALPARDWYWHETIGRRIAYRADNWWWRLHDGPYGSRWPGRVGRRLMTFYYNNVMLGDALHAGCMLIAPYRRVITTRLHGMILALLLGREVEYIDNSTGKISAYASTWNIPAKQFTHF